MTKRRTAAERIAWFIGWDFADMADCRYQPTRYANPAVYVCDNDYFCSPAKGRPPQGFEWSNVGEAYGHPIYRANGL